MRTHETITLGNGERGDLVLTPEVGGTIELTVESDDGEATMQLSRSEVRRLHAFLGDELGYEG